MSKDLYVFSTLSNDQKYVSYETTSSGLQVEKGFVEIVGGANVANKNVITPRGVATKVTAEQLEQLRKNHVFQQHEHNGFITISEGKADADEVAADMTGRDESAPLVDQDFKKEEDKPKTNPRKA